MGIFGTHHTLVSVPCVSLLVANRKSEIESTAWDGMGWTHLLCVFSLHYLTPSSTLALWLWPRLCSAPGARRDGTCSNVFRWHRNKPGGDDGGGARGEGNLDSRVKTDLTTALVGSVLLR